MLCWLWQNEMVRHGALEAAGQVVCADAGASGGASASGHVPSVADRELGAPAP